MKKSQEQRNNPTFATNKGIWQYFRASKSWVKLDSVGDSNVINFADKTLTNSSNISFTYAGTDQGRYGAASSYLALRYARGFSHSRGISS